MMCRLNVAHKCMNGGSRLLGPCTRQGGADHARGRSRCPGGSDPAWLPLCPAVGIGLLLAFTGLGNLGVIAFEPNTLVGLGAWQAGRRL